MAKGKKAAKEKAQDTPTEPASRSVLAAAHEAFERGDMVTARRLSREVLAGKKGGDDEREALKLAKLLSAEGAAVGVAPEDVAREFVSRTKGPPKPYLFALVAAAVFVLLVALAATRYS